MKAHWRRWRPQGEASVNLQTKHGDIYAVVKTRLKKTIPRFRSKRATIDQYCESRLREAKQMAQRLERQRVSNGERAEAWLYVLALQAPCAANAQLLMDKHPHGYHNEKERLFELIDFNDAYDAVLLALSNDELVNFPERIKSVLDTACKRAGARCFSNEQFAAITRGLRREIAVYKGAQNEGYEVDMANRTTDAFGIDMQILDPKTLKHINVDVKTRSSFYYRIQELHREGRLSDEGVLMADRNGFTRVYNGHNGHEVSVVIWRIDEKELGDITGLSFAGTERLGAMLRDIFSRYAI